MKPALPITLLLAAACQLGSAADVTPGNTVVTHWLMDAAHRCLLYNEIPRTDESAS